MLSALVGGTMKSNLRALIACAAGCLISGKKPSSVYDYSKGGYITISGSINGRSVQLYDHDVSCHFSGNGSETEYSFYHHGEGCHVSLTLNSRQFSGYDHGTGSHFSGQVNGGSISVYDHQAGSYFNYSI